MKSDTIAAVFARGGSKGLPGKNLRTLRGKTLLSLAVEHARDLRGVTEVYVSTDSLDIAREAENAGALVPFMRPADLASDRSPEWSAWQHLVRFVADSTGHLAEHFLAVPTTAPLRRAEDIEGCRRVLYDNQAFDGAICVTPSRRRPNFNMVTRSVDGAVSLPAAAESSDFPYRRQDAEALYEIVPAAYFMRTSYLLNVDSMWSGRIGAHVVPEERSVDIDSEFDFRIAEFLYEQLS